MYYAAVDLVKTAERFTFSVKSIYVGEMPDQDETTCMRQCGMQYLTLHDFLHSN